jgi:hypothetical protein
MQQHDLGRLQRCVVTLHVVTMRMLAAQCAACHMMCPTERCPTGMSYKVVVVQGVCCAWGLLSMYLAPRCNCAVVVSWLVHKGGSTVSWQLQ